VSFLEQKKDEPQAQAPQGALVPTSSIAQREGHGVVFIVSGDAVQQRTVSPVASKIGDQSLLPTGVQVGDTVVVSPPAALKDGDRIKVAAKAAQ
jgi:hypothetical protein